MAGTRDHRAVAALVGVALIWGGALSASSATLEGVAAVQQVALRFAVAALTLAVALPGARRSVTRSTLVRGLGLGFLLAIGFLLQTCALETTPVVTSAFLTGTVVVFAPVIAMIWGGPGMSGHAITGVLLAATGLALITLRGVGVGVGEAMTLAAALAWAVHLVALERWARPGEALPLALIQVAAVAAIAWSVAAVQGSALSLPRTAGHSVFVAGLGAVGTAAALVLLTWAQARVNATTAAVVLTLEPVFGATSAWAILGESLTPPVALGATAVVGATLLTAWDVPRQHAPCLRGAAARTGRQRRTETRRSVALVVHRPTRARPRRHHSLLTTDAWTLVASKRVAATSANTSVLMAPSQRSVTSDLPLFSRPKGGAL